MWSVPSRLREPSTAAFTVAALLSVTPGAGLSPEWETSPNLVHDDLVAAAPAGHADDFFAVEWAVDLGGVDVRDAEVEGPVDGADRLAVVEPSTGGVGAGHGYGAQADARDVQPGRRRRAPRLRGPGRFPSVTGGR
ncbi:hypothetical protein GCM10010271_71090 [Streptomyces kurssanovii]|nr:hypothetical protein GCM10010271_71090 [Streptomyces kurssanovii]